MQILSCEEEKIFVGHSLIQYIGFRTKKHVFIKFPLLNIQSRLPIELRLKRKLGSDFPFPISYFILSLVKKIVLNHFVQGKL